MNYIIKPHCICPDFLLCVFVCVCVCVCVCSEAGLSVPFVLLQFKILQGQWKQRALVLVHEN